MYNGISSCSSPYNPPAPEYGEPPTFMDSEVPSMYDAMPGTGLAVPNTASSSELVLQGYTAFRTAINAPPYPLTPDLELSDRNEFYNKQLIQAGYHSQQYNIPNGFTQPLNAEAGMAPLHPTQTTFDEYPPWPYASPSIVTVYPAMEYPSPPPSTFASPISLGGQIMTSLNTQSMHQAPELIPNGTMGRRITHSAKYERDLFRSTETSFTQIVDNIITTMAKVEVPRDGPIPQTWTLVDQKIKELDQYLLAKYKGSGSDSDLQHWIQLIREGKLKIGDTTTTPAAKDKARSRRQSNRPLCICFWCKETLTTKNNLGSE